MSSTSGADPSRFRSLVGLSTATLLVVIAGHAVRETARDALFLGGLPATDLPWAYLAIAAGAIAVGMANRVLLDRFSHRRLLVATLGAALLIDLLFFLLTRDPQPGSLFALYVWTGLLGTAVTIQLWLHLSDAFDVGESKRAFPIVAAGGLGGAIAGSVLAGALLVWIDTRSLLLASAALVFVAALIASALPTRAASGDRRQDEDGRREASLAATAASPYVLRIALLAVAVAMLATGIDYVFKHTVAATVPREALGRFFAWFNAGMNAFAMLFELLLASWVLRNVGVTRTIAILPASLLLATGSFAALGGLVAAIAAKLVDGALRPSLHQASTEVLFQPLSPQARNAAKTIAESLGKRGGQALASIAILAAAGMQLDARQVAIGLLPVSLLPILAIAGLRAEYVERFRKRIAGLAEDARSSAPRLDLHSLEALVSNLSSADDDEVLSAIELLRSYGRTSLISPLLLRHPSRRVVLRAVEILKGGRHPHLDALLHRLLDHADAEVRAAALNALVARGSDEVPIDQRFRSDPSPAVRSTAVVALAARHERPEEAQRFLRSLLERGTPEERIAIVRALPRLPHDAAIEIARRVVESGDSAEAGALARALADETSLEPGWIPTLTLLLARREARSAARAALLRQGSAGLRALERALERPETDAAVRRHLPRTLHRFGTPEAADILVRNLETSDPHVRYKILRGLGRMRADDPALPLDDAALEREAGRSLDRAIEALAFRIAADLWSELHGAPNEDAPLLCRVLADEESRALERVFRALHILDPQAEFDAIFEALRAPDPSARAEGRELVEHVVEGELGAALLAMAVPMDAVVRLREATRSRGPGAARDLADALPAPAPASDSQPGPPVRRDRLRAVDALIARLLEDDDPILSDLARDHFARRARFVCDEAPLAGEGRP